MGLHLPSGEGTGRTRRVGRYAPSVLVRQALDASKILYVRGFVVVNGRIINAPDLFAHMHGRKIAVNIHDCFWHGHERDRCKDRSRRTGAGPYPADPISPEHLNIHRRDLLVARTLREEDIPVLTIWECNVRNRRQAEAQVRRIERVAENWSRS